MAMGSGSYGRTKIGNVVPVSVMTDGLLSVHAWHKTSSTTLDFFWCGAQATFSGYAQSGSGSYLITGGGGLTGNGSGLNDGNWHLYSIIYGAFGGTKNGVGVVVYVDGVALNASSTFDIRTNSSYFDTQTSMYSCFGFGCRPDSTSQQALTGALDSVAIYADATSTGVSNFTPFTFSPNDTKIRRLWTFDGSSGAESINYFEGERVSVS